MCNMAQAQKDYQVNLISLYDLTPLNTIGRKALLKHMEHTPWQIETAGKLCCVKLTHFLP